MSVHYFIISLTLVYLLFRYGASLLMVVIILLFYSGLAAFLGKAVENPYKAICFILSIYLLIEHKILNGSIRKTRIVISFFLFSLAFLFSCVHNFTNPLLILSQFGKYFTPFCIFLTIEKLIASGKFDVQRFNYFIYSLLWIQIIISITKLIIFGVREDLVGTMTYSGGGTATVIPILGFIFIWLNKKGAIKINDWIFTILLLFVGVMSNKRAIWYMVPLTIALFSVYVSRKKIKPIFLAVLLILLPLIFYVGARLNPTLNREGIVWGSFDLEFVLDYTESYSFGSALKENESKLGEGRGGATIMLFSKIGNINNWTVNDIFGFGLESFATKDYSSFESEKFGLNSKGATTGFYLTYLNFGFFGVTTFLVYLISILSIIRDLRMRTIFTIIFIWNYFFYLGNIFDTQPLMICFFYLCLYSNFYKSEKIVPLQIKFI